MPGCRRQRLRGKTDRYRQAVIADSCMDAPVNTHAEDLFARVGDIELTLLLEAIYLRYHHDFRGYARASLKRRIAQSLRKFDCATISRLQERLLHEPTTFTKFLHFITVQVSEMFRDPSFF